MGGRGKHGLDEGIGLAVEAVVETRLQCPEEPSRRHTTSTITSARDRVAVNARRLAVLQAGQEGLRLCYNWNHPTDAELWGALEPIRGREPCAAGPANYTSASDQRPGPDHRHGDRQSDPAGYQHPGNHAVANQARAAAASNSARPDRPGTVSAQPAAHAPQPESSAPGQASSSSSSSSSALSVGQLVSNPQTAPSEVDGVNLEEIREFAKAFKIRRLSLGLTQTQVGQALSAAEGPAYSQSAICRHTILRSHFFLPQEAQENSIGSSVTGKLNPGLLYPARFEKLDITPKSAQKIKPVLERWMAEAEARHRSGMQNLTEFIGSEPSKKRKRRTSFTPQALEILNSHFEKNTHPSGQEMTEIAEKLNYDREVVRVWFCNKRQALKNTIKRLKQPGDLDLGPAVSMDPLSDSLDELPKMTNQI
ncbi:hypothetical protein DPEC_G00074000 [Dallia pectoralis]|uniref:Uncharacterized protein n=1 Tax=Dallia pectoralis TaxID=75939 RepID=A0ACC2H362_DALPE|nr:hypothetical protein DPEC_G00074000 [Dallia pectoralis]